MNDSENSNRFPADVETRLRESGWYPGRHVPDEQLRAWYLLRCPDSREILRIFPAALRVLSEFGGIKIQQDAPGITCSRTTFLIDPQAAVDAHGDGWIYYEWIVDMGLFPLGLFIGQDEPIAIDWLGRIIFIGEDLIIVANNFDDALVNFTRGIVSNLKSFNFADYSRACEEANRVQFVVDSPVTLATSPKTNP